MTNTEMWSTYLAYLRKEESEIVTRLEANRSAQREITTKLYLEPAGVEVGDTVWYLGGTQRKIATLERLEFDNNEPYMIWLRIHKSAGKPGNRVVACHYLNLIEKI
jgi:hypothetical protein